MKFMLTSIVEIKHFSSSLKRQVRALCTTLQRALSRRFYICMCADSVAGIERSLPFRGSLVLAQRQPAGERASRKTVLRRLFSISISLRMESPDWEVSLNVARELARFRIRLDVAM